MGKALRWGMVLGLACGFQSTACLSEFVIDNYNDEPISGGESSSGDFTAGPVAAGGMPGVGETSNTTIAIPSRWEAYGAPSASVNHQVSVSVSEVMSFLVLPLVPLVASLPDDHVIWMTPNGASATDASPKFAEYAPWLSTPTRTKVFAAAYCPSVMGVDSQGAILVAGPLRQDVTFGGPVLSAKSDAFYLVKLDADWNTLKGLSVVTTPNQTFQAVTAITLDAADNVYVAVRSRDSIDQLMILSFDAQLQERFRIELEHAGGVDASIRTLSASSQGEILAGGDFVGTLSVGGIALGQVPTEATLSPQAFTAIFDGSTGSALAVAQSGATLSTFNGYVRDDLGQYRLATKSDAVWSAFEQSKSISQQSPLLVGTTPDGQLSFLTPLGNIGQIDELRLGASGDSFVSGRLYLGRYSSALAPSYLAFGAVVGGSGTILSFYGFETAYPTPVHLALGQGDGFWLTWSTEQTGASGNKKLTAELRRLEPLPEEIP